MLWHSCLLALALCGVATAQGEVRGSLRARVYVLRTQLRPSLDQLSEAELGRAGRWVYVLCTRAELSSLNSTAPHLNFPMDLAKVISRHTAGPFEKKHMKCALCHRVLYAPAHPASTQRSSGRL